MERREFTQAWEVVRELRAHEHHTHQDFASLLHFIHGQIEPVRADRAGESDQWRHSRSLPFACSLVPGPDDQSYDSGRYQDLDQQLAPICDTGYATFHVR